MSTTIETYETTVYKSVYKNTNVISSYDIICNDSIKSMS